MLVSIVFYKKNMKQICRLVDSDVKKYERLKKKWNVRRKYAYLLAVSCWKLGMLTVIEVGEKMNVRWKNVNLLEF